MVLGLVIFITGGVRSGKSAFAEQLATQSYDCQYNIYYIASGVAFDEEMKRRIKRHQDEREQTSIPWKTIEILDEIPSIFLQEGDILLWDCITTWLNNVLFVTEQLEEKERLAKINRYIESFKENVLLWKKKGGKVILVSNEVLDELGSTFAEVKLYRKLLGTLHQWIVSQCDEAYELDYSICVRRK